MANIVIDPVIITMPSQDTSRDEVERWLENLTIWLQEALTAPFTWLHYQRATDLLWPELIVVIDKVRKLVLPRQMNINNHI